MGLNANLKRNKTNFKSFLTHGNAINKLQHKNLELDYQNLIL